MRCIAGPPGVRPPEGDGADPAAQPPRPPPPLLRHLLPRHRRLPPRTAGTHEHCARDGAFDIFCHSMHLMPMYYPVFVRICATNAYRNRQHGERQKLFSVSPYFLTFSYAPLSIPLTPHRLSSSSFFNQRPLHEYSSDVVVFP